MLKPITRYTNSKLIFMEINCFIFANDPIILLIKPKPLYMNIFPFPLPSMMMLRTYHIVYLLHNCIYLLKTFHDYVMKRYFHLGNSRYFLVLGSVYNESIQTYLSKLLLSIVLSFNFFLKMSRKQGWR